MIHKIKKFISSQVVFPKVDIRSGDDLSGVVAVVTGASRGIGLATVETILKRGGSVVAVSRDIDNLKTVFPEEHKNLLLCEADVTKSPDVKHAIQESLDRFGHIDVLVNNVAVNMDKLLDETTENEFDVMTNSNIKSVFLMTRSVLVPMKKRKCGLIVNIGSKISHNTSVGGGKVMYAMTKYAIEGFSYALNRELKNDKIRVSCLMPGTVNTFVSGKAREFLSPYHVAEIVATMIRLE